jgi:hypothetical protein
MHIVSVNSPVIVTEKTVSQINDYQPSVIYSIQLDGGMVITSPQGFEPLTHHQTQQRQVEMLKEPQKQPQI